MHVAGSEDEPSTAQARDTWRALDLTVPRRTETERPLGPATREEP